jgi:integrase
MATIRARKRDDGSTGYTAYVRIHRSGNLVSGETKTFSQREAAVEWAARREAELRAAIKTPADPMPLRSLLRWYLDSFPEVKGSKRRHLEFLERHPVGELDARTLRAEQLVKHIRSRRSSGVGAATALYELIWIGVVLQAAKSVRGEAVCAEAVDEARTISRNRKLIAPSEQRHRNPATLEIEALRRHFAGQDGRARIPMDELMRFAIHSGLRAGEICRLAWADLDPQARTGFLRDGHAHGSDGTRAITFSADAWEIIQQQRQTDRYIFPYKAKSVCEAFAAACSAIGIHNLRFDDLRQSPLDQILDSLPETSLDIDTQAPAIPNAPSLRLSARPIR